MTGRTTVMPPGQDEITGKPQLNYLVALALASGKLPEGENTNLNQVYEALVLNVWDRPRGSTSPSSRNKPTSSRYWKR